MMRMAAARNLREGDHAGCLRNRELWRKNILWPGESGKRSAVLHL